MNEIMRGKTEIEGKQLDEVKREVIKESLKEIKKRKMKGKLKESMGKWNKWRENKKRKTW